MPEGTRVYAIGDIHGRADLLRFLHRRIKEDAAEGASERKVLVYLGDYMDRGPQSREVIDILLNECPDGFETVFLKGNHEQLMLEFIAGDGYGGEVWLLNGGRATLQSYNVDTTEVLFGYGTMVETAEDLKTNLPPQHLTFLQSLVPYHVEGDYLFVHAGIRPGIRLEDQDERDLLWIRGAFLFSPESHGRIVVHGHTIEPEPDVQASRIGIDTGAYATGCLTCLVLEGRGRRFLQTRS